MPSEMINIALAEFAFLFQRKDVCRDMRLGSGDVKENRERERERERQTDRQTERERQRQGERETDRQIDRQRETEGDGVGGKQTEIQTEREEGWARDGMRIRGRQRSGETRTKTNEVMLI